MGNEMPNRTVLADAEQDSVDNQTPQEPSVGSVGSKVEDMPKSTPSIEGPKDDLGSGSKEDAVIHKDTSVPVEVDQPFPALKSEENQQKSAHEAGVLDVSAGKTIATAEETENQSSTPERASVSDEEAMKSKHGSSVNEELLSIDITGKNVDTAEEKEIQRCIRERTAMPDEEATESQHGSSMNEEVSAIDTNVSGGKIIDAAEEEEKQISTHEVAAVPDEEATKSKHGLSVNEEFLSIDPTNALGEPGPDLANESLILKGEENQVTSSNKQICSSHPDQSLQSPDYVNCPKLESWHEESGDDLKTPLLATAEGSPEVKKESVFPSDLNLNDSKVSLERTESEKLRMPLRHHLTDVPDTIPKQSSAPTEQGNAQVKSAEDVWESPARLVASPSRKDKQKTRSIFSQCICCPAVN